MKRNVFLIVLLIIAFSSLSYAEFYYTDTDYFWEGTYYEAEVLSRDYYTSNNSSSVYIYYMRSTNTNHGVSDISGMKFKMDDIVTMENGNLYLHDINAIYEFAGSDKIAPGETGTFTMNINDTFYKDYYGHTYNPHTQLYWWVFGPDCSPLYGHIIYFPVTNPVFDNKME